MTRFLTAPVLYALLALALAGWSAVGWKQIQLSAERAAHNKSIAAHERYRANVIDATRIASEAARRVQEAIARDNTTAEGQYQKGMADGKAELQGALDRARAGTFELQKRLRGHCPAAAGDAGAGTGPGGDAGGETYGLSDADVEFLVRFAGEAGDTARELRRCQAYVINLHRWWPKQ